MRRVGRLVSNHSLSALLFYPKINEHDFYLKLNSIPTFQKKYSKFWGYGFAPYTPAVCEKEMPPLPLPP